jgi:transposase
MLRIPISAEDLSTIHRDRFYHPHPHIMIRMHILSLHHAGENATRIAELLGSNRKTTQACLKAYRDGGLTAIYEYEKHKRTSDLESYSESIESEFAKHPPQSINEASARIEKLTGVKRSLTQVRTFLKKRLQVFEDGQYSVQSRSCRSKRVFRKHD